MNKNIHFQYEYHHRTINKVMTLHNLVATMTGDSLKNGTQTFRERIHASLIACSTAPVEASDVLPVVCFSRCEDQPTGLVLLSFFTGDDSRMRETLSARAQQLPQTLLTFCGSSGRTLKVVVAFTLPDGTLPQGDEQAHEFTDAAYQHAALFYAQALGQAPAGHESGNEMICHVGYAPDAWLNPDPVAMPLLIMDKVEPFISSVVEPRAQRAPEPFAHYSSNELQVAQFNSICAQMSFMQHQDDASYLLQLADHCNRASIDQELAVKCVLRLQHFSEKEYLVRSSFTNAYSKHPRGVAQVFDYKMVQQQKLDDFLRSRYRFRRNAISGQIEYRELNRCLLSWQPLDTRARNTITRHALLSGISIWDKDVKRYVESNAIEDYDPVRDYLYSLPQWDGTDRIAPLARRVPVKDAHWTEYFSIWMRSMVSQWMGCSRRYGSCMVLMLTGAQGTGKSTFMRMLLPPELSTYYLDRLDFTTKKDAERALTRFALINIDEYDQISRSQTAFLKHLLQKSNITQRKMYEDAYTQSKRYAVFAATTNSPQPLADVTGSRRYLVEEVEGQIDVHTTGTHAIDYPQLYAQLLSEIRSGQPAYFDKKREHDIQQRNLRFTVNDPLHDIFSSMYTQPDAQDSKKMLLSPMEILQALHKEYKGIPANRSNAIKLGKLLTSNHFRQVATHGRFVYEVARR